MAYTSLYGSKRWGNIPPLRGGRGAIVTPPFVGGDTLEPPLLKPTPKEEPTIASTDNTDETSDTGLGGAEDDRPKRRPMPILSSKNNERYANIIANPPKIGWGKTLALAGLNWFGAPSVISNKLAYGDYPARVQQAKALKDLEDETNKQDLLRDQWEARQEALEENRAARLSSDKEARAQRQDNNRRMAMAESAREEESIRKAGGFEPPPQIDISPAGSPVPYMSPSAPIPPGAQTRSVPVISPFGSPEMSKESKQYIVPLPGTTGREQLPQEIVSFYNSLPAEFKSKYPVAAPDFGKFYSPEERKQLDAKYKSDLGAFEQWQRAREAEDAQKRLFSQQSSLQAGREASSDARQQRAQSTRGEASLRNTKLAYARELMKIEKDIDDQKTKIQNSPYASADPQLQDKLKQLDADRKNRKQIAAGLYIPIMIEHGGTPQDIQEAETFQPSASPVQPVTVTPNLPPEARAKLKEGVLTTFASGETWTLKNGKPVKVK